MISSVVASLRGVAVRISWGSLLLSSVRCHKRTNWGYVFINGPKLMNRNVTAASLSRAETCVESGDPPS